MSDRVIQKLCDLSPEDLSYAICNLVFGEIEGRSEEFSKFVSLEEMKADYKAEIRMDTKVIVKTYDNNHKEKGEALVLKKNYKNLEERENYIIKDGTHLIIISDSNCYIDVKHLSLGEIFPSNRNHLSFSVCRSNSSNLIDFFTMDYKNIWDQSWRHRGEDYPAVYYSSDLNLMASTRLSCFIKDYQEEAKPLVLSYIKAESEVTTFAALTSMTRQPELPHDYASLKVTFIPAQKIGALLGE